MPHPKVKISDNSGNEVAVTSNALDVNIASGTADIDIGDVSLLLDGTAADYGTGNVNTSGRTLRVTLASDDVHFGAVGAAADVDGVIHGQLRYIGNSIADISGGVTQNQLRTSIEYTIKSSGGQYTEGDNGHPSWAVRNDTLASLVSVDNDYAPLQVNASGALYTTHGITGGADGVTVVSSAGTHVELASSTACKKVDIQAQTDNTGLIAVGFDAVDATEATGTGVILYAGDTYSLEINNLNLIYIDSTVSGEGVRYTYFT